MRDGARSTGILLGLVVLATLALFIPYLAVKLALLTALAAAVIVVALVR